MIPRHTWLVTPTRVLIHSLRSGFMSLRYTAAFWLSAVWTPLHNFRVMPNITLAEICIRARRRKDRTESKNAKHVSTGPFVDITHHSFHRIWCFVSRVFGDSPVVTPESPFHCWTMLVTQVWQESAGFIVTERFTTKRTRNHWNEAIILSMAKRLIIYAFSVTVKVHGIEITDSSDGLILWVHLDINILLSMQVNVTITTRFVRNVILTLALFVVVVVVVFDSLSPTMESWKPELQDKCCKNQAFSLTKSTHLFYVEAYAQPTWSWWKWAKNIFPSTSIGDWMNEVMETWWERIKNRLSNCMEKIKSSAGDVATTNHHQIWVTIIHIIQREIQDIDWYVRQIDQMLPSQ